MGVPLRGHRDDSRYQPDVGEPTNHPRVGNFLNSSNLQFDRETKLWGIIWKLVAAGRHTYQKQHKTLF